MATTRRLTMPLLVGVVLLLAAVVLGVVLVRDDDAPVQPGGLLTVTWGGEAEGTPGCVHRPGTGTVEATLLVTGAPPPGGEASVTVTAFADENTSEPVGSTRHALDATTPSPLVLTIDVDAAPHVDEDGVAACSMLVTD